MKLFIFLVSILLILFALSYYKYIETFENTQEQDYLQKEEKYFESRLRGILPSFPEAEKFYKFDTSKPLGQQLEIINPSVASSTQSNVDEQVKKCSSLTSCNQLDGTNCGYCFSSNRFYYGDDKGPLTDVCEQGWVRTGKDCQEYRERAICSKITNCNDMVGEASICAWCPTTNKAMPYVEQNGILVPKYPDKDKCDDEDITTGKQLGLVKQSDCAEFAKEHPCIGPNENNGPHSDTCLEYLWQKSGCSPKGKNNPLTNTGQKNWWNQRGWTSVFTDMKNWFSDANSSNWDLVKTHYEGCYGTQPDPCNPKYNNPLECYQKKFTEVGCTTNGSAYPKTKPSIPLTTFIQQITTLKNNSHDSTLQFNQRNDAYNKCYGGHLTAPPAPKVGDYVQYEFTSNWGSGTKIKGYLCVVENNVGKVFWERVENSSGSSFIDRSDHLNDIDILNKNLGLYCGQQPNAFPNVPATIPLSDLTILKSCDADTSCDDNNCSLQNVVYLHYPAGSYSVLKTQVTDLLSKATSVIPNTRLCNINDIQNLVNFGIPYCACGWVSKSDGNLTSVYPSTSGTSSGCGGGQVKVVSCGDNGPSWAGGKAGVYVIMSDNPTNIPTKLAKVGITGSIVATIGKNEYTGLIENVQSNVQLGYIGCFKDSSTRTMPIQLGVMTYDEAMAAGKQNGYKYIGLQDATAYGLQKAQVWASNDETYNKLGTTTCVKLTTGQQAGGPWANAVYQLR